MIHLPLRVRQTLFHVQHILPGWNRPPAFRPDLARRLSPGTEGIFRRLSTGDQIHSIAVALELLARGASDELVLAGLLHDIGKIRGPHRITVVHRVAQVLLRLAVPGTVERLRDLTDPPPGIGGVWMLAVHDIAGARIAGDLGYPERVQWLIRHHQHRHGDDAELELLRAVDDRAPELRANYT